MLLAVLIFSGILFNWGSSGWVHTGPGMMGNWGFGPIGWIGMLIMRLIPIGFFLLVVADVAWLVRALGLEEERKAAPHLPTEPPLSPREITREQYMQMMEDLS